MSVIMTGIKNSDRFQKVAKACCAWTKSNEPDSDSAGWAASARQTLRETLLQPEPGGTVDTDDDAMVSVTFEDGTHVSLGIMANKLHKSKL